MKFKIVTSPLDGGYDPVAQFEWLVEQGLLEPKKEYDEIENLKKNEILVAAIQKFVKSLKNIDEDTDPEKVAKIFDTFEEGCEPLDYYTSDSSDALIKFLDVLIEMNDILEEISDEIEFYERFVTNYFELFSQIEIPRPVLWHIVNSCLEAEFFITSRDYANYMGHAITENKLSGDVIVFALLQRQVGQGKTVEDVPVLGTNQLFCNPSVTIQTLERLAPWYISNPPGNGPDALDCLYIETDGSKDAFDFDFSEYGGDFYIGNDVDQDLSITEFALVTARMIDELKLGRLRIEELATSRSKILRTIAYFWPGMSAGAKDEALKLGVVEINTVTEEFLKAAVDNPRISAFSDILYDRVMT
jgi:hypothetical protein